MGTCKYCGQKTLLFSTAHNECAERHDQGMESLLVDMRRYFSKGVPSGVIARALIKYRRDNYLSDGDIAVIFNAAVSEYTSSLRRPYSPDSMHLVDTLINVVGVPYQQLSQLGATDEFAKLLMRGFMIDYFTERIPLDLAQRRCESVLKRFPMSQDKIDDAYWHVLDRAATKFLSGDTLPDKEQQKIQDYVGALGLQMNNVPTKYQNGDIAKIGQVALLKSLQQGVIPQTSFTAPILLSKGEAIIWAYNGVNAYQEKVVRQYRGRSSGLSFRLMRGVYYRTGGNRSKPVEYTTMELQGMGTLYVTNKNLIFYSPEKSLKVAFNKIISITPYVDRIEVQPDGATAKRLVFVGFDPWLLMNIVSFIGNC